MLSLIKHKLKSKKAFTLVELLIVIAVLGIIAAIAVPRFAGVLGGVRANADVRAAELWISSIGTEFVTGGLDDLSNNSLTISEADPNGFDGDFQHMISNPNTAMIAIITYTSADELFTVRVYPGDVNATPLATKVIPGPLND